MKQIEKKTILNDIITQMHNTFGSVAEQSQLTANILNSITSSKKKIKPLRNPKLCNYPNSSRKDDFNFNEGLGAISLQPQIDQLNNFKQACIKAIKTKFEAMGPESSKDSKLALGAASTIKEVLEAAKCFTRIVKNVNNLIDSYIQSITKMTIFIIEALNQLESDILKLKKSILEQGQLVGLIQVELLSKLEKSTDIFETLNLILQIQLEINKLESELNYLSDSPERLLLTINTSLTLLKNRLDSFINYSTFLDVLNKNLINASTLYMTDNFLDDFDLKEIQASSFNWSITNTGELFEYNSYDELNIIPKLNDMFKNYKSQAAQVTPLVIASKTESGYIVMPELEESLISCGLDPLAGYKVGLVIELSINSGETIIRAVARGENLSTKDNLVKKQLGKFANKGLDTIEYTTITTNTPGSEWTVVTDLNTNLVNIGDRYIFIDPVTKVEWKFSYGNKYFPVLFEITNKTHNTVSLRMLNDTTDYTYKDFISDIGSYPYNNPYENLLGTDTNGKYVCVGKIKTAYILADLNGDPVYTTLNQSNTSKLRFKTTSDLPVDPNLNDTTALTWTDGTYTILKSEVYSFLLKKYNKNNKIIESPHAGEKIPCLNWTLSVYPIGEDSSVNKIRFSSQYPTDKLYRFFLKAHWGFIPEEISTAKLANTTVQDKQKAISNNFLKVETQ